MPSPITSATTDRSTRTRIRPLRRAAVGATVIALGGVGAVAVHVATDDRSPRPAVVLSPADAAPDAAAESTLAAATPVPSTTTVDVRALWQVILDLEARQSAVIVPALAPDVRAALEAIVHGIVYEGLVEDVGAGG
jgi:hypothetical protein